MPQADSVSGTVLPKEHSTTGFLPYDEWFDRGYLRGLDHGRFHEDPDIAQSIQDTVASDDIRFRGEHLTVHTTSSGTTYAVLWEEWFGTGASTWVRHPSEPAARAWTHAVAAHWLREYIGSLPSADGRVATWGSTTWGVERDLVAGRWNVVLGLAPGMWTSFRSTKNAVEGWEFITGTLAEAGIRPVQWPDAMRQAHAREAAPAVSGAPTGSPAEAAEPQRGRVRGAWLTWWHTVMAWLRRPRRA